MRTWDRIESIMAVQDYTPEQKQLFKRIYSTFRSKSSEPLDWEEVESPGSNAIVDYETLDEPVSEETGSLLGKLAVCKLNGGLGTSMGCVGPKSAVEVRDGKSFLDLIVTQVQSMNQSYNVQVPLVLMNSFNTNMDTDKIIRKYEDEVEILTFQQNQMPRLRRDSLLPVNPDKLGVNAYYPPGHGDFYDSICNSGTLDKLLSLGKKFLFVANADNLGATVDLKILSHMERFDVPFIMEVTPKTRADVKGGTLVNYASQGLRLLEIAQVHPDYVEEFKSVKKFKIFNTNNIWINLEALKKKMDADQMNLDVIVNKKTVEGVPVIQLETAIGSGINHFDGSIAVNVDRARFLPVKKTDDLLLVQSNLFQLKDGALVKNPNRQFDGLPLIRLGEYFKTVDEYQERLQSIPDILELDLLTVVGDISFGKDVTLRGNVILVCEQGELRIPRNSLLENKVLTGSIKMGEL